MIDLNFTVIVRLYQKSSHKDKNLGENRSVLRFWYVGFTKTIFILQMCLVFKKINESIPKAIYFFLMKQMYRLNEGS